METVVQHSITQFQASDAICHAQSVIWHLSLVSFARELHFRGETQYLEISLAEKENAGLSVASSTLTKRLF